MVYYVCLGNLADAIVSVYNKRCPEEYKILSCEVSAQLDPDIRFAHVKANPKKLACALAVKFKNIRKDDEFVLKLALNADSRIRYTNGKSIKEYIYDRGLTPRACRENFDSFKSPKELIVGIDEKDNDMRFNPILRSALHECIKNGEVVETDGGKIDLDGVIADDNDIENENDKPTITSTTTLDDGKEL